MNDIICCSNLNSAVNPWYSWGNTESLLYYIMAANLDFGISVVI